MSRIETFERDEIVRVLTRPGVTMPDAALELGMSRATIYRKPRGTGSDCLGRGWSTPPSPVRV